MQLPKLDKDMKLYCRRPVTIGEDRYEGGQEFPFLVLFQKGEITWRLVVLLYRQRRVISEADPYFEEVMRGPGLENNPEFAANWLGLQAAPTVVAESDPFDPEFEESKNEIEIRPAGGGWFEVLVDGKIVSPKRLRREDAERLAKEF
jgi:hypothetical protein